MAIEFLVSNYKGSDRGWLSLYEADSFRFIAHPRDASLLPGNPVEVESLPDFDPRFIVTVNITRFSKVRLFVLDKTDIEALCAFLSDKKGLVSVMGFGVDLARFNKGRMEFKHTVDKYFPTIEQSLIDEFTF